MENVKIERQRVSLEKRHSELVKAVRRLVHAKKSSNIWLELTDEYKALAAMVAKDEPI